MTNMWQIPKCMANRERLCDHHRIYCDLIHFCAKQDVFSIDQTAAWGQLLIPIFDPNTWSTSPPYLTLLTPSPSH